MSPADGSSETSHTGRAQISRAAERQMAKSLSPAVAWPTLALALTLPITFAGLVAVGLAGWIPMWVCTPILALVSYGHYSLVHEAIHGNVVAEPRRLHWLNTLVGWIGAICLGIGWPLLQRTHVLHHSHTNTDKDPDIVVKGTLIELIWKWGRDIVPGLIPVGVIAALSKKVYSQLREFLSDTEILQCSIQPLLVLGLLAFALATGNGAAWFWLLFAPQQLAVLILMIFFQWLPHHPFDRTDRYGATRISLWAGGKILTLQQNLHLMHHLWPSVPFYNYAKLYVALRPLLEAEGSRIEGFAPRSPPPHAAKL